MSHIKKIVKGVALLLVLTLAACHRNPNLEKGAADASELSVIKYGQKVISHAQTGKTVTAKARVRVQAEGKDITLNGNLKMMRDEVIQLSLSLMGFEVGHMEFSKDEVLVIDRVHRQFVKVPYQQVDFLGKANVDFNVLQAVFWNEIFVPGVSDVSQALNQFTMASSGDHTLLSLRTAPKLDYGFLTQTASALLSRTTVTPKNISDDAELVCKYGNFSKLNGREFPTSIDVSFKGEGKTFNLVMTLSDLGSKTEWTPHSQVSSKYKQVDARGILKKIMSE
ncbi:MAG: DUF4292 domain-containing protein [Bacteroidaceae bacterium]|nr:DUF4292 domain-containing protein [Bacteroidaceae bacterium]